MRFRYQYITLRFPKGILKAIVKEYHARVSVLEEQKYDTELASALKELEARTNFQVLSVFPTHQAVKFKGLFRIIRRGSRFWPSSPVMVTILSRAYRCVVVVHFGFKVENRIDGSCVDSRKYSYLIV